MANYRRNAEANRDALFGPSPGGSSGASRKKPASRTTQQSTTSTITTATTATTLPIPKTAALANRTATTRGRTGTRQTNHLARSLKGQAKIDKMKEAEEYRKKAKKALQRSLFSSPDPIAGAMFYHRAAEAYKLCGENRLERLHRIASADCQMGHDAYATAASEYMRAAELSEMSEETDERKRAECTKLYADAAKAWREAGEAGRAGECMLRSGFSLLIGSDDDGDDLIGGQRLMKMKKDAKVVIEAAVESHVPDPLNRHASFRQTGISSFIDPEAEDYGEGFVNEETLEMCRHHMVKSSFAHETLSQAVHRFVEYGEYKSALYAAGAVTAILESDGFSTISLSRAFCVETILALALGDVVAADKVFLEVHLQNNNYLSSRECKLAEDLIRAVKMRDLDDLEMARDISGGNKSGLSNLDPSIMNVVANIRISGAAKKRATEPLVAAPAPAQVPAQHSTSNAPSASMPESVPTSMAGEKLQNELDDLMNDMGLGSDDEDEIGDDDFDLR